MLSVKHIVRLSQMPHVMVLLKRPSISTIRRGKILTEAEARQILGVAKNSSWAEILQKYDKMFERNAKNGSFYLQSKVHRAKECLEAVHNPKAQEAS